MVRGGAETQASLRCVRYLEGECATFRERWKYTVSNASYDSPETACSEPSPFFQLGTNIFCESSCHLDILVNNYKLCIYIHWVGYSLSLHIYILSKGDGHPFRFSTALYTKECGFLDRLVNVSSNFRMDGSPYVHITMRNIQTALGGDRCTSRDPI